MAKNSLEELGCNCAGFASNLEMRIVDASDEKLKSLTRFIAQGVEIRKISVALYGGIMDT